MFAHVDDSGMSLTMEQVVTQLQQEIFTLKELMLLINLDLLMQCEPSPISRQLKVRKILQNLIDSGKEEDVQS